jgi:hypothetical protein
VGASAPTVWWLFYATLTFGEKEKPVSVTNVNRTPDIFRDESTRCIIPLIIDDDFKNIDRFKLVPFLKQVTSWWIQEKIFNRISENLLSTLPTFELDKKVLKNILDCTTMEVSIKRTRRPRSTEVLEAIFEFYDPDAVMDLSMPRTKLALTFNKANEAERFPRTPEWDKGPVPSKFFFQGVKPQASTFVMFHDGCGVRTSYQHCFLNIGYGDEVGVEHHGPTVVELVIENQPTYDHP